jgi:hypothetical protein
VALRGVDLELSRAARADVMPSSRDMFGQECSEFTKVSASKRN